MKIKATLQILAVCLGLAVSLARASGLKSTGAAALGTMNALEARSAVPTPANLTRQLARPDAAAPWLQSQQRPAELIVGWTAQLNILSNATTIALGGTSTTNVATTNGITNLPPASSELKPYDTFLLSVDSDQLAALRLDLSGTFDEAGGIGGLLAITQLSTSQPSTHRACADANGNVSALMNADSGQESARYEYDPFGNTLRATGPAARANSLRFSTQFTDDLTRRVKYLYRDYDAGTGRWLSRDPIEEQGGLALYCFVSNDSINWYDPSGLMTIDEAVKALQGIGNGIENLKTWIKTQTKGMSEKDANKFVSQIQAKLNATNPAQGQAFKTAGKFAKRVNSAKRNSGAAQLKFLGAVAVAGCIAVCAQELGDGLDKAFTTLESEMETAAKMPDVILADGRIDLVWSEYLIDFNMCAAEYVKCAAKCCVTIGASVLLNLFE